MTKSITKKYRVLEITNNLKDYPDCEKDTLEFPHLVKYIEDEYMMVVMDTSNGYWWIADEFFYCVGVQEFTIGLQECLEEIIDCRDAAVADQLSEDEVYAYENCIRIIKEKL